MLQAQGACQHLTAPSEMHTQVFVCREADLDVAENDGICCGSALLACKLEAEQTAVVEILAELLQDLGR